MRHVCLLVLTLSLTAGCANVIRSGLMNSNSIMMPPGMERTIYVHVGNMSENQLISLHGIRTLLSVKGYAVLSDPAQGHYWLQARVIYCHTAKPGVTAESVAQTGFGTGIGSGGGAMPVANLFIAGGANSQMQMPDFNAMMAGVMPGMGGIRQPPPEGVLYLCVADVQVTEQAEPTTSAKPVAVSSIQLPTYTVRSVAHVLQKKLNLEEATPIIQDKLNTGIAGLF